MIKYWFKRHELLQKAKDKYNNCAIKEKANNEFKNLSEKEKEAKREYGKNRYERIKEKSS